MLSKMKKTNNKGFTLIELMIVIAIIGILAAIAIPNFIAYRNKAFCSSAEADGNNVAAALSDYFSVPNRTQLPSANPEAAKAAGLGMTLSGANTGTIAGTIDLITIRVTDASGRCPSDYRQSQTADATGQGWNGSIFGVNM